MNSWNNVWLEIGLSDPRAEMLKMIVLASYGIDFVTGAFAMNTHASRHAQISQKEPEVSRLRLLDKVAPSMHTMGAVLHANIIQSLMSWFNLNF